MNNKGDTKMIAAFLAFAGAVMFLRVMTYEPVQLSPGQSSSVSILLYVLFGALALLVLALVVLLVSWYLLPSLKNTRNKTVELSMQMRKFNSLQGQIERALDDGLIMKAVGLYGQLKSTYTLLNTEEQQEAKIIAERLYRTIVDSQQKLANNFNY